MTIVQKAAMFPLHRWLDRHDTWRLFLCLALAMVFPAASAFSPPIMLAGLAVVAYVILTRWAWITNRLR